jgi:HTH-type transcriptional regulator/antitoxin HigA
MKTINKIVPAYATHPGEIILDELEANGISQVDFAKEIGLKKSQLNKIIKGKRNINADLAIMLENVLGIDAEYWLNAQNQYDLDQARIKEKKLVQYKASQEFAKEFDHDS